MVRFDGLEAQIKTKQSRFQAEAEKELKLVEAKKAANNFSWQQAVGWRLVKLGWWLAQEKSESPLPAKQ